MRVKTEIENSSPYYFNLRNLITLTACVNYQNESHNLQDTWLKNFDNSKNLTFFANSEKGWIYL